MPTVVLIVVDTLRWDRLSLAGYPRPTSPRIDQLAADSVVFRNAYAPASWTRPSVASLMTGLNPRHHGAVHWDQGLGVVETLAELLWRHGYATRAVVANPFLEDAGFERGFERFEALSQGGRWQVPGQEINRRIFAGGALQPGSFLYAHYLDPHDPYAPGEPARSLLVRPYQGTFQGSMPFLRGPVMSGRARPDESDLRYLSDLYDAEVRTADAAIGELLDWLRETGVYEDALVILTADHGEEFLDHGGWLHGYTLYEEQLHVPLLIKPPRSLGVRAGVRAEQVTLSDVAPTVIEIVGLSFAGTRDGQSLVPSLRGATGRKPRTLLALAPLAKHGGIRTGFAWATRDARFKWIRVLGEYPYIETAEQGECYDIRNDPQETRNLAGTEAEPCKEIARRLEAFRKEGIREGARLEVEAGVRRRLEALGYTP